MRLTLLPDPDTTRWSVVSRLPRRSAVVYARSKREAELLGCQVLGVAPDRVIAVRSEHRLHSLEVA